MKRNTLHFITVATLLATQVKANDSIQVNLPLYHNQNQLIFNEAISANNEDPIYNLFQLTKLITSKNENLVAAGYINNLLENSRLNDDEKESIRLKLYKYLSIESKKLVFKEKINEYLVNQIKNINDENFAKSLSTEELKKIQPIISLNKILVEYKSINIIANINKELPVIYTSLSDMKSDNDLNNLNIQIEELLKETNENELKNLDEVTLKKFNNYYVKLKKFSEEIKDKESQIHQSINSISTTLNATEYKELINRNIASNKFDFLKTYPGYDKIKVIEDTKETTNHTATIQFVLNHYKSIREFRNTLFNNFVDDKFKISSNQLNKLNDEKQKLDVSIPLKTVVQTEKLEEKTLVSNKVKLPSESDIINGLALFMANRAKQETMIWFVDKLKKDLENSLIKSSFPATYNKLMEHDDLRVPEFNESWQLAISEDFVKMPQNILNSSWLDDKASALNRSNELEKLKLTYNFSQRFVSLLNGKNDFRNVLEDLYTQKEIYEATSARTSLYRSIEFLYILSNEFFDVEGNKFKNLSFSDFEKLNEEQWNVLLALVQLKYGKGAYEDLNYFIYKLKNNQSIENVNRKFAYISNAIESIEHITKSSDFTSKEEKATELINKSVDLLKYFDPEYNPVNNQFNSSKYLQIEQFEDILKIYNSINKKEFGSATKSLISFIKPILTENIQLEYNKGKLEFNINKSSLNLKDLFLNNDKKNMKETETKKVFDVDVSKFFAPKEDTTFKINLISNQLQFKFKDDSKLYTLNFKELINKWANLKKSDYNDQDMIKLLSDSNDTKLLVNKFLNLSNLKSNFSNEDIKNYIKLIGLVAETVDNPLQFVNKLTDSERILNLKSFSEDDLNKSGKMLVKTTTFFSDILHARDEKGVYRAINNAVAPPTSYMTKRKYPHTLSLNGYVGGYFGYQKSNTSPSDYKSSLSYGITAPIGITYSTEKWGLFVYPIDLGNLVGHYIWETNKGYEKQKVSVKEIFSPGISFLYNIPDSPFVLFTGMKMVQVPERFIENFGYTNSATFDLIQVNAGIKIDIPFFTIKAWKPTTNFIN